MATKVLIVRIQNTTDKPIKDVLVFNNQDKNIDIEFKLKTDYFKLNLKNISVQRMILKSSNPMNLFNGLYLLNCFKGKQKIRTLVPTINPFELHQKEHEEGLMVFNESFVFNLKSDIKINNIREKSKIKISFILNK